MFIFMLTGVQLPAMTLELHSIRNKNNCPSLIAMKVYFRQSTTVNNKIKKTLAFSTSTKI